MCIVVYLQCQQFNGCHAHAMPNQACITKFYVTFLQVKQDA